MDWACLDQPEIFGVYVGQELYEISVIASNESNHWSVYRINAKYLANAILQSVAAINRA